MQSRGNFIGNVATGHAGTLATGAVAAGKAPGAGDRIRPGIIGVGDRGTQLARKALACPNTEIAALGNDPAGIGEFELGFEASVICPLAAESCLQARTVYWDATREEIV